MLLPWKAKTYKQSTITKNISLLEGFVAFKGQYIWAIYNNREYFTLGGCLVLKGQYIGTSYNNRKYFTTGNGRPIHTYEQREQSTITITDLKNISLWEGVWSWKATAYKKVTITENISLWEDVSS